LSWLSWPSLRALVAKGWTLALLGFASLTCGGCGGGVPLLYPARTLAAGDVRVSGGTSANLLVGSLGSAVSAAHVEALQAPPAALPPQGPSYAKGALVLAAVAPGVAPYTSGRVGLGERFEGGVTYTGRAAHVDVRRSFDSGDVSLSLGLGLETPVYGDTGSGTLPQVDLSSVRGYGADIPVVVGWQSAARVYMLWGGLRAGWDHVDVASPLVTPAPGGPSLTLVADRFYGSGVLGLAAGFRHVHAALELDVAYQTVQGMFGASTTSVQGLSVAPAGALWVTF
jgi:hypothetical protein